MPASVLGAGRLSLVQVAGQTAFLLSIQQFALKTETNAEKMTLVAGTFFPMPPKVPTSWPSTNKKWVPHTIVQYPDSHLLAVVY